MNQQERDDLRAHWNSWRQHRTHFADCYKWHPECAVIQVLDEWQKRNELITQLTKKHVPLDQNQGAIGAVTYCVGCKTPGGLLNTLWPCDVVKLIEASK